MSVENNLKLVREEIKRVTRECRREENSVTLLAVSKTKPLELLQEAYNAGQRFFGENRIQEAEVKVPLMPEDASFHLIGHLQSNKVSKACKLFSCIQSVDSLKIAEKINSTCAKLNKVMDVYLDINIVNDENKTGFIINDDFYHSFESIIKMDNLNVVGLMCIGAHVEDREIIKKSFRDLKQLLLDLNRRFTEFKGDKLSMGMSGDYEEAIIEGSTMIRVGSSIFGKRF